MLFSKKNENAGVGRQKEGLAQKPGCDLKTRGGWETGRDLPHIAGHAVNFLKKTSSNRCHRTHKHWLYGTIGFQKVHSVQSSNVLGIVRAYQAGFLPKKFVNCT